MRIISDYSDYYDCIQSQGQSDCVWVRDRCYALMDTNIFRSARFPYTGRTFNRTYGCIGFCGEIYPFIVMKQKDPYGKFDAVVCYDVDSVADYIKENHSSKENESFNAPVSKKYDRRVSKHHVGFLKSDVEEHFDNSKVKKEFNHIFIDCSCPVFIAVDAGWYPSGKNGTSLKSRVVAHCDKRKVPESFATLMEYCKGENRPNYNPMSHQLDYTLNDLNFYTKFDVNQTFQEIEMYLSGVLGMSNPDVPVPDDVTMRDIKGFDKFSFKKQPSKTK